MTLFYFTLLICTLQWALAAPTFSEPHFFAIDEAPTCANGFSCPKSMTTKTASEPLFYKRFIAPSKALLTDLLGGLKGQARQQPAAAELAKSNSTSISNSTNTLLQARGLDNTTSTNAVNSTTVLSRSSSDPAVLAKRRMAIPKLTSPFANSRMVVESRRRRR